MILKKIRSASRHISARSGRPLAFRGGMFMINEPSESHSLLPTRASLLRRIGDPGDTASWTEFYRLYKNLVFGFARRSGLAHADAEEVTQDVFNRVSQTIHEFESNPQRGTFRGWLRNLTRWRVMDKLRERQRLDRMRSPGRDDQAGDDRTATIERVPDPSIAVASDEAWDDEWEKRVLDEAMARLRDRVDARHFQVFELHVCQGRNVTEIAQQLEMNRAAVYVIHFRLKKQLIAEVTRLKGQLK
jgi:RNA polymerase sigma factor (sigma-70 family)